MNSPVVRIFIVSLLTSLSLAQSRQSANHTRGLLHQTVYNTGELGRAFDGGQSGMSDGCSSMEWPPNSTLIVDGRKFQGQHNSMGGGLYLDGVLNGARQTVACGAVATAGNGLSVQVAGIYSFPGSITRTENYPVLPDGSLNPSYNPNEAEEIIVADWSTPLNIMVTRTSRAWSFPGYDSFIIYEYDLVNTNAVPITDGFVGWGYGLSPSMFGYERLYNEWSEAIDMRSKDMYARFDFKRWMSYNHDRTGKPDTEFFSLWSQSGDRGGLNTPQAVGFLPLHYDHDHLAVKGETNYPAGLDSTYVWDETNRIKQPYTNRYENRNLDITKISSWTDIITRKTSAFGGVYDSTSFLATNASDWTYWKGRAKPSSSLGWKQPVVHGYVFGPYIFPPNEHIHFAVAEVVGYGPGVASDSIYSDLGGGVETSGNVFHRVPSWYSEMNYPTAGGDPPAIGSSYLQTHPLPWYVTPGVVSIRDVADRAIQMYTGSTQAVKYDTVQFDPANTPLQGRYNSTPLYIPAPAITVEKGYYFLSPYYFEEVSWGAQVESFAAPRLSAPFSHYILLRAPSPLGPWVTIDSISKMDTRYLRNSTYTVRIDSLLVAEAHYYAVVSVDTKGNRSGLTSMVARDTILTGVRTPDVGSRPDQFVLGQNFPNPFNPSTTISFSLPTRSYVMLSVFNMLGQKVIELVRGEREAGSYSFTFDASGLASGVYLYRMQAGSFVQTKKLVVVK